MISGLYSCTVLQWLHSTCIDQAQVPSGQLLLILAWLETARCTVLAVAYVDEDAAEVMSINTALRGATHSKEQTPREVLGHRILATMCSVVYAC